MSQHQASVVWQKGEREVFSDGAYSRAHQWHFDGGITVEASASPQVVPLPYSVEENVDPEEAFIAAIASCHLLTFLGIAAKRRWVVAHYEDQAVGVLSPLDANLPHGIEWVSQITLTPKVAFTGKQPSSAELAKLHQLAHKHCFIANSVKTDIRIELGE